MLVHRNAKFCISKVSRSQKAFYIQPDNLLSMGRKPGLDEKKIASIVSALSRYPDGIWLRKLAEETGLNHATVAKYIDRALKPLTEDNSLGSGSKPLLRVIRLKPVVLEELQKGKDLQHILKILKMMSNYK